MPALFPVRLTLGVHMREVNPAPVIRRGLDAGSPRQPAPFSCPLVVRPSKTDYCNGRPLSSFHDYVTGMDSCSLKSFHFRPVSHEKGRSFQFTDICGSVCRRAVVSGNYLCAGPGGVSWALVLGRSTDFLQQELRAKSSLCRHTAPPVSVFSCGRDNLFRQYCGNRTSLSPDSFTVPASTFKPDAD